MILRLLVGFIVLSGATVSFWMLRHRHRRNAIFSVPLERPRPVSCKVYAIFNPTKSDYLRAKKMVKRLAHDAGWPEVKFLDTSIQDPGTGLARQALADGADLILAGGGDGTLRAVTEALVHQEVPLGVIPLGTGNILARNLGCNLLDLECNVRAALFGCEHDIDTGIVNADFADGSSGKYRFLGMAGIGFDALVLSETSEVLKEKIGWVAYSEAGVRYFPGKLRRMSMNLDGGRTQSCEAYSVLFANCGIVPGGIDFVPKAFLDDGLLDVVVVGPTTVRQLICVARKVLLRSKRDTPGLDFYAAEEIVIEPEEAAEIEVDGDPIGTVTKASVSVDPRSLRVKVAR